MSAPAAPAAHPAAVAPADACPLCGTPLQPDQEWCLRCGAAARTRLAAAAPGWKTPIAGLAVLAALALGVLAAALVDLARESGPAPAPVTHVVTAAAAPAATVPATTPGTAATTPTTPATSTPTTTAGAAAGTGTVPAGTRTRTTAARTGTGSTRTGGTPTRTGRTTTAPGASATR